jgi:hypothetical protein
VVVTPGHGGHLQKEEVGEKLGILEKNLWGKEKLHEFMQ